MGAITPVNPASSTVLSHDEWIAQGRDLAKTPWRIGRWYSAGAHYGWSAEAEAITGLARKTLEEAARVAEAFPEEMAGQPALSFAHYATVVSQPPARREQLLSFAAEHTLTVAALREHIRAERPLPPPEPTPIEWPNAYRMIDAWNAYIAVANEVWASTNQMERRQLVANVRAHLAEIEQGVK